MLDEGLPCVPLLSYLILILCHLINSVDGWESRWVKSDWKKDENMAGEWNYTAGKWNGDANDKGKHFTMRSRSNLTSLVIYSLAVFCASYV